MMNLLFLAIGFNLIINGSSFILIPEEFTTLLNILYSRLPPTRIGTDSKVGLGFRIGKNADFQVVFEIGPQQNSLSDNSR